MIDEQTDHTSHLSDDPIVAAAVKWILLMVSIVAAVLLVFGPIILLNLERAQQSALWPMLLPSLGLFVLGISMAVVLLFVVGSRAKRQEEINAPE